MCIGVRGQHLPLNVTLNTLQRSATQPLSTMLQTYNGLFHLIVVHPPWTSMSREVAGNCLGGRGDKNRKLMMSWGVGKKSFCSGGKTELLVHRGVRLINRIVRCTVQRPCNPCTLLYYMKTSN